MLVKGKVTQEHINKGKRCEAFNCPVHYSIKEIFPNAFIGIVGRKNNGMDFRENYSDGGPLKQVNFPYYMLDKIQEYDKTGKMEPFDYEFEI